MILTKAALLDGERLSKSYSKIKIYIRELKLGYIPIHACKNDYILFHKDNKQATEYPKYGEPRYKTDNRKEDTSKDFEIFFIDSKTSKVVYVHKDS